jgi:hypothetical protein
MRDRLRTLLLDWRRKRWPLHYSLLIALAGAELDLNHYDRGKALIDELDSYYVEDAPPADRCNLAIGLTYLYYYAWHARKRTVERQGAAPPAESQKASQDIQQLIKNAVVYAERATSLVGNRELAQRVYVYNQHLFCLVESGNQEKAKEMREAAAKLSKYRDQDDVWSYMYYDTLSRYYRWRAMEQTDEELKRDFMREAKILSDDAIHAAPHDEEIKKFHSTLIDESDQR